MTDDWAAVREAVRDETTLRRAVVSGAQRGFTPQWRRVELRYVELAAGLRLQVVGYDDTQAHTSNHSDVDAVLDELLGAGYANWHVESTDQVLQVRVTRKGKVLVHRSGAEEPLPDRSHDHAKDRLVATDAPFLRALGITDGEGRIKPSRQAKYRQVEEFVRALDATLEDAWARGALRRPSPTDPLRVVDLGCGNAYLTFAAQEHLAAKGIAAHVSGVDVKEQSRGHNARVAAELGLTDQMSFVQGSIESASLAVGPDVVLALHACDTATDDALARAVGWQAPVVLAAPCCHHDIAAQLKSGPVPAPYQMLVRDGILRERLADTLTDALRASRLRAEGYRVDVVEFVPSQHTPRNTLLRAVRTGRPADRREYDELVAQWSLNPRLGQLLER